MVRYRKIFAGSLLLILALTACGGPAAAPQSRAVGMDEAVEFERPAEEMAGEPAFAPEAAVAEADFAEDGAATGGFNQQTTIPEERLIIRTADLTVTVDDTLETMDAIGQMATSMGGFVVTSNSFQSRGDAYEGFITVRVPADRFDEAIGIIKQMSVEVNSESTSGQDVTEEFVDLDARVTNLKAAEQQLQEILDNAQDTEDVLNVFNELTRIRGEIESLEGRMQYLSESARLSTINVNLQPNIITQPVDVRWKPLETVKESLEDLGRAMADVVDFLIRFVIVILPSLLVILLVIGVILSPFFFVVRGVIRRRRRRRAMQPQEEE